MQLLLWLALATIVFLLAGGVQGLLGARRISWLREVPPLRHRLPSVSVVIPALNEEEAIRRALTSVLALDYRPLEIIVVNDRSTDRTGEILDRMAREHPGLTVIHLSELPAGWLGKNHALMRGAALARGEYLLFMDADVVVEPTTLRRAMARMLAGRLDHLTLFFTAVLPSSLLKMVVLEFGVALISYVKPWKAPDPDADNFVGIGAFNLVRAEAYRAVGGHAPIRLCPIDDMMLGKLLKRGGFRQESLFGYGFVKVRWYGSIREMARGLMKNTFAALEYRVTGLVLLTLLQGAVSIWPFWALFLTSGATRLLNVGAILLQGVFLVRAAKFSGIHPLHVIWFPLTPYIRLYMTWKACLSTLAAGGITWRDTFYPLEELKKNRLR